MIEVFQPPRITREETAYKMLFHVLRLLQHWRFPWLGCFIPWLEIPERTGMRCIKSRLRRRNCGRLLFSLCLSWQLSIYRLQGLCCPGE